MRWIFYPAQLLFGIIAIVASLDGSHVTDWWHMIVGCLFVLGYAIRAEETFDPPKRGNGKVRPW